jgi:hypothetical protein
MEPGGNMIDEEEIFLAQGGKPNFKDKDYDDANKTLNRVKQFTFIGERQ